MTIRSLESKKFSGEANSPQAPPGEQVAQSQANQNTNRSSGPEPNRSDGRKFNPGSINIHYMSGFVIGNGSFVMNGKVANDDFHLEKHSQQNDQIPTGSSDSSDKQTSTAPDMRNSAENPASIRRKFKNNISPGAKFMNCDMSREEFLRYFCEGND